MIDPSQEPQVKGSTSPDGQWVPDGLLVAGSVLVAVFLVIGAVLGWNKYRGSQMVGSAAPTSAEASEDASPSTAEIGRSSESKVVDCPEGTVKVVCEAAEYVQLLREKPFKTFPDVELLDGPEFTEALLIDYEAGREDLEHAELAFKGLGLMDGDVDLYELFRSILEINVVGFYDPKLERLAVRGNELNLYAQSVLVHELVHALDDQWFDLDREPEDDEAYYGFVAVAEGNATRVDEAWTAELDASQRAQLLLERAAAFNPEELDQLRSMPAAILELQQSPYSDGLRYLQQTTSDEAQIDSLLENPPLTSERILHPASNDASDPQIEVAAPEVGTAVINEGKLGEVVLRVLLGEAAAEGWEGDSFVVWRSGNRDCIAAEVASEPANIDGLNAALQAWAREDPGRSVERNRGDEIETVSFTNC